MDTILNTKNEAQRFAASSGDYMPAATFLTMRKETRECFAIFGCTHVSEAARFISDEFALVVSSDDYEREIRAQTESDNPELSPFYLR